MPTSLSAWLNQLRGAVTMFLMAPRKEELRRVSFGACCASLVDVEEDNEDAIIIIHNENLTRGLWKEGKEGNQNTTT